MKIVVIWNVALELLDWPRGEILKNNCGRIFVVCQLDIQSECKKRGTWLHQGCLSIHWQMWWCFWWTKEGFWNVPVSMSKSGPTGTVPATLTVLSWVNWTWEFMDGPSFEPWMWWGRQGISENRFKEINSWKSWLVMTLQLILKIRYCPVDGTVHNQTG